MTTPNTDLEEQIAVALYNNAEYYGPEDVQPGWECLGDEEREEWRLIAAAVLPIIAAEVRAAKAEAWDECVRAAYTPEGRITHGPNPYHTTEKESRHDD